MLSLIKEKVVHQLQLFGLCSCCGVSREKQFHKCINTRIVIVKNYLAKNFLVIWFFFSADGLSKCSIDSFGLGRMVCEFTSVYLYLHADFVAIQCIKFEVRSIFDEHMKCTLSFCLLISDKRKILMLTFPDPLYFPKMCSIYMKTVLLAVSFTQFLKSRWKKCMGNCYSWLLLITVEFAFFY